MKQQAKIKVLYDTQLLKAHFFKGNRRGIFFTGANVLKELVKHPDLEVKIYSGMDYDTYRSVGQFIESQPELKGVKTFQGDGKHFDIFLSPSDLIQREIKETGIICYSIIYDLIPMVCPEHGNSSCFFDIINSLT
jgi:hypothetical protein